MAKKIDTPIKDLFIIELDIFKDARGFFYESFSEKKYRELGIDYKLMDKTHFTVDYNYFADLFAQYNPDSRTTPDTPQPWEVPAYGTFDTSVRYGFTIGGLDTTLIARMNNVFDTEYVADARDGQRNDAATAQVWYGYGRTFNISAKIKF